MNLVDRRLLWHQLHMVTSKQEALSEIDCPAWILNKSERNAIACLRAGLDQLEEGSR